MTTTLQAMRAALAMTKQRCYNPKTRDYKYYGGRGIRVCERWLQSFEAFVEDMGLRPEGTTLEREDNNGHYEPGNCVWATRAAQSNNTRRVQRFAYDGKTLTLAEWSALTGIAYSTLKARLGRLGYTPQEALTKPVKCGGLLEGKVYRKRRPPDMSKVPRGLDSANTKLTRKQVLAMRKLHRLGETFTGLSKIYGVSIETASQAVQGHHAYKDV